MYGLGRWSIISLALGFGCGDKDSDAPVDTADNTDSVEAAANAGEDIYVALGESITLDAGDSTGTLEWNLGDGTVLEGSSIEHTYTDVGRMRVVLSATGSDGSRDSDTLNVVVHHPLSETEAQSSHAMVILSDAVWTILPESNALHKLPLNESEPLEIYEVCEKPSSIAHHEGRLAIGCSGDGRIALLDTAALATDTFIDLPAGSSPSAILRDNTNSNQWWCVDSATGRLGGFTWEADPSEVTWYDIGTDLKGLSQHSDGTLLIPEFRSQGAGLIHTWNPLTDTLSSIVLGIDTYGDSDNTTGGIPNLLENVYPSPDGLRLYTPYSHANILRGMYLSEEELTHETSLRAILGHVDWTTQTEDAETRKHFDEKGRTSAVAFSEFGDLLYVLHPGVAQISVVDRFSHQILNSVADLGIQPTDVQRHGDTLYVYSWLTRDIIALSVSDPMRPAFLWQRSFIDEEPLNETILWGKQLFHNANDTRMTKTGYIACAHCHPAGDHDGQTWDFTDRGEGLRNTTSLLGRGAMAMGPYHWSGNFDEAQDFEGDIRLHFDGAGYLNESDWESTQDSLGESKATLSPELDALAAYMYSLTETPTSPHTLSTAEYDPALDAFNNQGCSDCHGGSLWTDSALDTLIRHDIGTLTAVSGNRLGESLDGLDTPTLLGIWSSAPYLHDGSAATIEDAIRAHTGYENLDEETMTLLVSLLHSL